jgi:nitrile hydratase
MDGAHDLGGRAGFGEVDVEVDEPVFHHEWEGRTFGIAGSMMLGGLSNGPTFRHAIERMDPVHYLSSTYYEHWLTGLATLAAERGVVSPDELEARAGGPFPLSRTLAAAPVVGPLDPVTGTFEVGDRVRVRNVQTKGHTRCPAYVRGQTGTVVRVNADEHVPELEGHAGVLVREPCYSVRFDATELWGDDAEDACSITVDLIRRYLEAA